MTPADLQIQLEWRMQLDAHLGTLTDAVLFHVDQQRFDLPYAGRLARNDILVAYVIRTPAPDAVTALLWIDEDARIAFIAAADAYETFTRGSDYEMPGEAVPRLADTLAWWAYVDTLPSHH